MSLFTHRTFAVFALVIALPAAVLAARAGLSLLGAFFAVLAGAATVQIAAVPRSRARMSSREPM
ncbi:hypothetical protein AB0F81_37615 [Actinoplanes sp. NPDC024001]|uniref:hypothetical protein n=1 Tax=Actinoplanes sp. NPDC024001 TaxID=3154598 RepID=UPI0033C9957C